MEKGDGPKVSFPANILECSICNEVINVPLYCAKTTILLVGFVTKN